MFESCSVRVSLLIPAAVHSIFCSRQLHYGIAALFGEGLLAEF